jgi:probable rRNA maturation factor
VSVTVNNRQRRWKINTRLLARIAERTLELVGNPQATLSVAIVSDAIIAKLNARYHNTPGPTDILSFDYGEGQGELIISVEHAVAQANRFRTTPARELVLYVVHGILHLHGYNDHKLPDRRRMRAAERRLMACLASGFKLQEVIFRRASGR